MPCVNANFRTALNFLGWIGISQTLISYDDKKERYILRKNSNFSRVLGLFQRLNIIAKISYLTLLELGMFGDPGFQFLEQLSVGFWYLVLVLILIAESFWFRTYPFFEIICAGLEIPNEVSGKIDQSEKLKTLLNQSVTKKVVFQVAIIGFGVLAMILQYSGSPKYPLFTGFMAQEDSLRMTLLFGLHEVSFVVSAWLFYGSAICFSSIVGTQLTISLNFMTEELGNLPGDNIVPHPVKKIISGGRVEDQEDGFKNKYGIQSLIVSYRKFMIYIVLLNEFASYKFLYYHTIVYLQMIGNVFIVIHILRSGQAGFWDVFFYIQDCAFGMLYVYKCFKSMGTVKAASEGLLHRVHVYLADNGNDRKMLLKVARTLKTEALKIGPCSVGHEAVGNSMMILIDYYIMAALW